MTPSLILTITLFLTPAMQAADDVLVCPVDTFPQDLLLTFWDGHRNRYASWGEVGIKFIPQA